LKAVVSVRFATRWLLHVTLMLHGVVRLYSMQPTS